MKVLLVALNSKFIHSNLALRYLRAACLQENHDVVVKEFSINDSLDMVLAEIYGEGADVIGFSCYIWNIEQVLKITSSLKKINQDIQIILGGPEVSYDSLDFMSENPQIDYIIRGEGERSLPQLLHFLQGRIDARCVEGLVHKSNGQIVEIGECAVIKDLSELPDAYVEGWDELDDKIIYYETSRGCPYQCQYCLSSINPGVRYLPMDRVKRELRRFVKMGVKQVKLVDRTFNANPKRACEIFEFLIKLGGKTNFHFEMEAHLITEEMLTILKKAPKGLFQFEIGVQSTNEYTLQEIKRTPDFLRIAEIVRRIGKLGNIHLHLDLIAGLPGENLESFSRSFNDVYNLHADRLQLGFLKLLRGSGLRRNAGNYGYRFTQYPPYEVLSSSDMSFEDILLLKGMEDILEKLGNSHKFKYSLAYLERVFSGDAFELYRSLWDFWKCHGYHKTGKSYLQLLDILYEFGRDQKGIDTMVWREILKLDYVLKEKRTQFPTWMDHREDGNIREKIRNFYRNDFESLFPDTDSYPSRQYWRYTHIELFPIDIWKLVQKGERENKPTFMFFDYTKGTEPIPLSL